MRANLPGLLLALIGMVTAQLGATAYVLVAGVALAELLLLAG